MAACEFQVEALKPALHRPAMIGGEDRLQKERERVEQTFTRADLPVVSDIDVLSILLECPDAAPLKIAERLKGEAGRVARLRDTKLPVQRVGQPAFRVQLDQLADAALIARLQHLDFQIDGRPPARQIGSVFQNLRDLFRRASHTPARDEMIVVSGHLESSYVSSVQRGQAPPPDLPDGR